MSDEAMHLLTAMHYKRHLLFVQKEDDVDMDHGNILVPATRILQCHIEVTLLKLQSSNINITLIRK
jgi:hypothetical protein